MAVEREQPKIEKPKDFQPWFKNVDIGHECSLDIEAYECPICWRRAEQQGKEARESEVKKDV